MVALNPKYNVVREADGFSVTDNEEYVDTTKDFRLNFLVLCGPNGVGKSTLLRLLSGRHGFEAQFTVCWIDSLGEVACNKSIKLDLRCSEVLLGSRVHNYKLSSLCGNNNLGERGEENHISKSILSIYSENPTAFNLHGKPVFDGFHLNLPSLSSDIDELESKLCEHLGMERAATLGDFQKIVELHPTFHVLALIAQDSTFNGLISKLKSPIVKSYTDIFDKLRDKTSDRLDKEINEMIYANGVRGNTFKHSLDNVVSRIDPNWNKYKIKQYDATVRKLAKISNKVDNWINKKLKTIKSELWKSEYTELTIWKEHLMQLVLAEPYTVYNSKLYHLNDLSDGEYSQIRLLFNLAPMIMPPEVCWFYLDDVDDNLHPEWNRNLVNRIASTYLEFTNRIAKSTGNKLYSEKILTCVIATHSPFVLSDLSRDCVLQFRKDENGKTVIQRSVVNTFAGNIGQLFHSEFFMDSTIGEFARQQIKKAIKSLDSNRTPEVIEASRKLFSNVGDEVLRGVLMEKCKKLN